MLENTGVYVCTICGFIYIGDKLPDVCPVCKVPNWNLKRLKGGNMNGQKICSEKYTFVY